MGGGGGGGFAAAPTPPTRFAENNNSFDLVFRHLRDQHLHQGSPLRNVNKTFL